MPFVLGFALVQALAWILGTFVETQGYAFLGSSVTGRDFFLPVVAVPTIAAWVAMELALVLRRPSLFVAPWSTALARCGVLGLIGVGAGLLTLGAEGVTLTMSAERVSDWWIMGLCPFTVCIVLVGVLPRHSAKAGCTRCGYDWRGLARCPECATTNPTHRSIHVQGIPAAPR